MKGGKGLPGGAVAPQERLQGLQGDQHPCPPPPAQDDRGLGLSLCPRSQGCARLAFVP